MVGVAAATAFTVNVTALEFTEALPSVPLAVMFDAPVAALVETVAVRVHEGLDGVRLQLFAVTPDGRPIRVVLTLSLPVALLNEAVAVNCLVTDTVADFESEAVVGVKERV